MSVRLKLALTVLATGLVTALGVMVAVLYGFQRFEHETTFQRANAFLARVTAAYDDLLDLQQRRPDEFRDWLRSLVLYEPDTQLYLLDAEGLVLASTGQAQLPPGFKVAIAPVRAAVERARAGRARWGEGYVMGDDPERMDADAVVAAWPLRRAVIRPGEQAAGYLYLVCHTDETPEARWAALRGSLALPTLAPIAGIVALASLFAALIIAAVTRPLRRLTEAVAQLSAQGLEEDPGRTPAALLAPPGRDEFGRLTGAFAMMLETLRRQWAALRRLDHFRREGVSNLSHDLRSPLTATVACLETLQQRWGEDAARAEERRLVEVALRNSRNAARLVQSLGELARLDEPAYALQREPVDVVELLDQIRARFAERARAQQVQLRVDEPADGEPVPADVDVELFERAVANLVDNALKHGGAGCTITLAARREPGQLAVRVADTGPGIAAADLPHLFDRFYQARASVAPATGEGGKGLGLAIVKRIVELHGGQVDVSSHLGAGTTVQLTLPLPASG
ncbi:MAG: HAMP domain-containing protein [Piscinibacter sp.]|uniref:sensor histidine kinase n=1 Tax=Piscinibacter TaxID=1114981 RepID=UPI000FDCE674|nr:MULTISPECIES: HAMP domain-containing sensor histidine kinase [Piscinibacter]MCW5665058.1 HAMP domain-containing protein [Piscinibacter sp.]